MFSINLLLFISCSLLLIFAFSKDYILHIKKIKRAVGLEQMWWQGEGCHGRFLSLEEKSYHEILCRSLNLSELQSYIF